jgi:regulator of RNase E activity RraA
LESINAGDVLVVGNAFDKHAFFGELMSKLAKSNGVEGAIINGCTRDKLETIRLRYPVFSKNNIAQDIKKRGTIDEIDAEKTIIGGVEIKKGDYILADLDGVIVIPSAIRQEVFARSLKIYENEKRIKKSISNGQAVDKILKRFGEF